MERGWTIFAILTQVSSLVALLFGRLDVATYFLVLSVVGFVNRHWED